MASNRSVQEMSEWMLHVPKQEHAALMWRAPISQQLILGVKPVCGVVMKHCSFPSSCALTFMGQDQPDGLCGRKIQSPMCHWWILCQPRLKQKSLFGADLPVVNTHCVFLSIVEQLQFEWPKLLSEETITEDLLWVCTKYAPTPNNDDWNHELSSAPWKSLIWIECTPWKISWTFGTLCSSQQAPPACHMYWTGRGSVGQSVVLRTPRLWDQSLCGLFT